MNPELDIALVRDFPNLYRDRHASMQMTCMCWGFPGDGWEPLIRELSEILEPMGVVAAQVKEKYGTLRFYVDYPERMPKHKSMLVDDAISAAEQRSAITCEVCGEPGTLDDNHGWLATLCENHTVSRYKEAP